MTRSIILLRGLTRGTHHWGAFPDQLKAAFGQKKIIPIDLAGNGDRYKEASPVSIKLALEDIRNEVRKLNLEGPVTILALSLGGMITLQWLNDYPDEIDKAIIINSSHAG
ncbi:MAG TPA: alpha/beta hydrolase, partial [Oceanospirillales bacterium]|nr:alpha/beta hydrolase [Oceanospirillales bacterium]